MMLSHSASKLALANQITITDTSGKTDSVIVNGVSFVCITGYSNWIILNELNSLTENIQIRSVCFPPTEWLNGKIKKTKLMIYNFFPLVTGLASKTLPCTITDF